MPTTKKSKTSAKSTKMVKDKAAKNKLSSLNLNLKNYKIIYEDYDHNDLYEKIKKFKNKTEAIKYAKEIIATTSDDSKYYRIFQL